MRNSGVSLSLCIGGALSALAALALLVLGAGAAAAATVAGLAAVWSALVWRGAGHGRASSGAGEDAQSFAHRLDVLAAETGSARAELDQLRELLADAIARLVTSFGALYGLAERGQASAPGGGINADFARQVNDAVTALQFQDMANQLVGHIDSRVAVIERLAEDSELTPAPSSQAIRPARAAQGSAELF